MKIIIPNESEGNAQKETMIFVWMISSDAYRPQKPEISRFWESRPDPAIQTVEKLKFYFKFFLT